MARRVAVAWVFALVLPASAFAQGGLGSTTTAARSSSAAAQTSSSATTDDTRPATTTFYGDTGLWFVPTAEIVPHGKYSASGYRTNWDYRQGLTDVSHFPITGAGGLKDRVEIFGSFRVVTRIDRDLETPSAFRADPVYGGLVHEYPFVRPTGRGTTSATSISARRST